MDTPTLLPSNHDSVKLFNYLNPYSNNLGVEAIQVAIAMGFTQRDIEKALSSCVQIWRKLNASK